MALANQSFSDGHAQWFDAALFPRYNPRSKTSQRPVRFRLAVGMVLGDGGMPLSPTAGLLSGGPAATDAPATSTSATQEIAEQRVPCYR